MSDVSNLPAAVSVARLTVDLPTARQISDVLSESFDPEAVAIAAFEEPDGRWPLALYFRDPPNETAVRALVALAAGPHTPSALIFETLAPTDWVRTSLEGLKPVEAGRFVVHGAHDRARVATNRIGIEIEAALAFGTGHHGTTRGCLLALDWRIAQAAAARRARVLDIGTGTGVLAIAAAKALRAAGARERHRPGRGARSRATMRGSTAPAPAIEVMRAAGARRASDSATRAPFDLVFANILLGPLQRLATPIAALAAPGAASCCPACCAAQANAALARLPRAGPRARAAHRARGLGDAGAVRRAGPPHGARVAAAAAAAP